MAGSDFVDVQLSAAGIAAAGGQKGSLRITAAHLSYQFKPGARVRVLTSEWAKVLSKHKLKGQLIFELAPAIVAGSAPGTPIKAQLKNLQAEEAQLQAQVAKEGGK
jgi:hypothetical protein